jgi:hypothetical protein
MLRRKGLAIAALTGGLLLGAAVAPAEARGWDRGYGYGYGQGWTATPGLDRHQWRQEQVQRHGLATGRITPRESHRIDRAQHDLLRREAWAKADGVVTPRERWSLQRHSRQVDALIAREYNDYQPRPRYGYGYTYHRGW